MYCAECNQVEIVPNPYGIDVCTKCHSESEEAKELAAIGAGYTENVLERRIAELEAELSDTHRKHTAFTKELARKSQERIAELHDIIQVLAEWGNTCPPEPPNCAYESCVQCLIDEATKEAERRALNHE